MKTHTLTLLVQLLQWICCRTHSHTRIKTSKVIDRKKRKSVWIHTWECHTCRIFLTNKKINVFIFQAQTRVNIKKCLTLPLRVLICITTELVSCWSFFFAFGNVEKCGKKTPAMSPRDTCPNKPHFTEIYEQRKKHLRLVFKQLYK